MPTSENDTKTRGDATEQARTPLLAALGAGDLAAQTIADALTKLRARLGEGAESARHGVNDLPNDLKERFDPAELRKLVDAYTRSAAQLYGYLAERGETTFERLQSQPQVKQAWSQLEQVQGRVDSAVGDARVLADDVLGKVTRTTRSWGEKAAEATEKAGDQAAEQVRDTAGDVADAVAGAGSDAATATRSTTRKAANRTAAAKSAPKSGAKSTAKPKATGKSDS
ncbi:MULTISPECIES: hypothetical protein [unclassified Saccharopolyspora]|uniref:hypothetical protein n=1 Tax=unclassified Saccharopolyspora TaxID=2646250 RepID=UPI001CD5A74F|nr:MULTISPECIES: hypothetical protein [unclassified Saccharopolyspora]MCA1186524.1 hypothetical protein [Saccharopolyspora sp. 6T]MCA1227103.1 hypothetical protein [Saccharopolyspora sp. 6M]